MFAFVDNPLTKHKGNYVPYELIRNSELRKEIDDTLFADLGLPLLKIFSVSDSHMDTKVSAHCFENLMESIQYDILRLNLSSPNRSELLTEKSNYIQELNLNLDQSPDFVYTSPQYISSRIPVSYHAQSSDQFSAIPPSTTLLSGYINHILAQELNDPYHFNSLPNSSSNLMESYNSSKSTVSHQMSLVEFNQQQNNFWISHNTQKTNSSLLKSEVSSYIRSMYSTNKKSYQFSEINLSFDSLKTLVSEKNTIFEKIEDIIKINVKVGINIKLLYIFRAYLKEIEVILVTNEDKVYCYGHNWNGVLGFGHDNSVEEFTFNEELSNQGIIEFGNSECHTIARNINGKLFCWGKNYWGCLGNGREDRKIYKPEINTYLNNETIIDMCCGYRHTLVLTSKYEVYAWGDNDKGQIGNKIFGEVVSIPFKVEEFNGEKVATISSGFNHSMSLTQLGNVFSWGCNENGQCGHSDGNKNESKPKRIQIDVDIQNICCGQNHSILLSHEGDIYVFGRNREQQLGIKTFGDKQLTPIKLNYSEKFIEIASNYQYNISAAHSEDGLYYVWGNYGEEKVIREPEVTHLKSFDEIFAILLINHT